MQDADEAERRGDAEAALGVIRRRPLDPEGGPFWRSARVSRLEQLVLLKRSVPKWATSRWILEQALQHLSEEDRGPRSRIMRASSVAVELRGGWHKVTGRDSADKAARVADHDWVHRQMHLFELGGLEAFLRVAASPDLVACADQVKAWANAPMGGFLNYESGGATLLWADLSTREVIRTPNIGTTHALAGGRFVIGRLVPIEGGRIFESTPLVVPPDLARKVAAEPSRWLELLRESGAVLDGSCRTEICGRALLLSDLPVPEIDKLFASWPGSPARVTLNLAHDLVAAAEAPDCACPHCLGHDDEWDASGQLYAALLDPRVLRTLPAALKPADVRALVAAQHELAEPARSWLGSVLKELDDAA